MHDKIVNYIFRPLISKNTQQNNKTNVKHYMYHRTNIFFKNPKTLSIFGVFIIWRCSNMDWLKRNIVYNPQQIRFYNFIRQSVLELKWDLAGVTALFICTLIDKKYKNIRTRNFFFIFLHSPIFFWFEHRKLP